MYMYYYDAHAPADPNLPFMYISFLLATTLSCILLIIYRIVAVASLMRGAVARLGVYRQFIEVLVESSALYLISLILYLAVLARNDPTTYCYLHVIPAIAKGIAPTLLIGRAAAGHTLPRDDRDGSTLSSLRFRTPSEHSTTRSQGEESIVQSSVLEMDIETQQKPLVVPVEQDTVAYRTE